MTDVVWHDERVALLKKLVAEGLTSSQIAIEMGCGLTRNSIIGKIDRLGLNRPKAAKSATTVTAADDLRRRAAAGLTARQIGEELGFSRRTISNRLRRLGIQVAHRETVNVAKLVAAPLARAVGSNVLVKPDGTERGKVAGPCTFFELSSTTCRWPIGDPGRPDFAFCGCEKPDIPSVPYCSAHRRMASQPGTRR